MGDWESVLMVQQYSHLNVEYLAEKGAVMDGLLALKQPSVQIYHAA
jgi:hypothetical protein